MIAAPTMANVKYKNSNAYSCEVVSEGSAFRQAAKTYIVGPADKGLCGGGGRGGGRCEGGVVGQCVVGHGDALGGTGGGTSTEQDKERATWEGGYL